MRMLLQQSQSQLLQQRMLHLPLYKQSADYVQYLFHSQVMREKYWLTRMPIRLISCMRFKQHTRRYASDC